MRIVRGEAGGGSEGRHAVLYQYIQALLDGQRRVEDDKSETKWKNVIAGTDFEEVADGTLQ